MHPQQHHPTSTDAYSYSVGFRTIAMNEGNEVNEGTHFLSMPNLWPYLLKEPSLDDFEQPSSCSTCSYGLHMPCMSPSSTIYCTSPYESQFEYPPNYNNNLEKCADDCDIELLQRKLEELLNDARNLREHVGSLSHSFKMMTADCDKKRKEVTNARLEMVDRFYMEKFLCLLNGDLPLHKWPFRIGKIDDGSLNLVV